MEVRVFLCPPPFAQGYGWQAFVFVLGKVAVVKESFGVVAQLIERYVRIVEVVGLSPISSTKVLWGYGGMVDAEDLKSFGHCDRVGSSPTIPTTLRQGYGWQATKPSHKATGGRL